MWLIGVQLWTHYFLINLHILKALPEPVPLLGLQIAHWADLFYTPFFCSWNSYQFTLELQIAHWADMSHIAWPCSRNSCIYLLGSLSNYIFQNGICTKTKKADGTWSFKLKEIISDHVILCAELLNYCLTKSRCKIIEYAGQQHLSSLNI